MEVGEATVKVSADTTQARQELAGLVELTSELGDVRLGRFGSPIGDAIVVSSVLGFVGYLIHVFV